MKITTATAAGLACFVLSQAAWATDVGAYLSLGAGVSAPENSDVVVTNPNQPATSASAAYDAGWGVAVAGGYKWDEGFRTEIEADFRRAHVSAIGGAKAQGIESNTGIMGNLLFDIGTGGGFQPYLGAGAGIAWNKWSNVTAPGYAVFDGNSAGFQYQGIFGIEVAVARAVGAFVEYRYMGTLSHTFQSVSPAGSSLNDRGDASHNVLIGARYSFGAAAK